ncbi:MAG: tetratricopeptide repeat protein [Myxococcota bacterium]|nr:tetratricopeptide repeat protein [Myxococcota bacterium]
MKFRRGAALFFLILVTTVVHWPLDRADFSYDDRNLVQTNPAITSIGRALEGFRLPFPPSQPERALYRPLTGLTYAVDAAFSGLQGAAFHRTNVALYALLVVLLHRLALAYRLGAGFAFASALLFAMHPIHTEAVDSVSGRSELLSLLFSVGALLLFLRVDARGWRSPAALGSAALYALACLSKESGSVMLAVLAVHAVALRSPALPNPHARLAALRPLAPHAAVLLGYILLRSLVLGRFSPAAAVLGDADLSTRFWTMGSVFWIDFVQLIAPLRLELDFYYQARIGIVEAPTTDALLGWAILVSVVAAAIGLARSQWRAPADPRPARAAAVCAFALLLFPLFPTSHALPIGALFSERFLFAPSLGFVLLATLAGRALLRRSLPPRGVLVAATLLTGSLALAGAVRSHSRALEWRDAVQLWRGAQLHLTDKRAYTNLAAAYLERGELDLAAAQITRALELDPHDVASLGNRGVLELQSGDLDAATETFEALLKRDPGDALTWFNLGQTAQAAGDPETAASRFQRAVNLAPGDPRFQQALNTARKQLPPLQGPR